MIQEVIMYAVACDACGKRADYGEVAAWTDRESAVDMACGYEADACFMNAGGGKHYCPDHYCRECEAPNPERCPEGCPERDWMCAACCQETP